MHYVIPSMIAMLFSGFYSIVDGLFVGNSIGNVGLAAINLVYPIQVVLNATATGVGIGGSVLVSIYRGEGKRKRYGAQCHADNNTSSNIWSNTSYFLLRYKRNHT